MIRAAPVLGFRDRVLRGLPLQVVTFRLGGEVHACEVALVEEVVSRRRVHPLPDVPGHVLGVLSLRGELLPVVDVAPRLGLSLERDGVRAVLVVAAGGDRRVGVAAERVDEVVDVPPGLVRPAPHGAEERGGYVVGVARLEGGLVNLIDLAEMLRETIHSTGEEA